MLEDIRNLLIFGELWLFTAHFTGGAMLKFDLTRRSFAAGLMSLVPAAYKPAKTPIRTVAFNYAANSTTMDWRFYTKFDVLVIGGILPPDQLSAVQSTHTQVVLYRWSSALYPNEGTPAERNWQRQVERRADSWLLSPEPTSGGAAAKKALWFDFGNADFTSALAAETGNILEENKYRGVFLDTLGFASLPEGVQREFTRRNPGKDYDSCQGEFLAKLRARIGPGSILFTNQGYRNPKAFLPDSDLDLIENSATLIRSDGSTLFRPWLSAQMRWESIQVPMKQLILPAAKLYPRTQFVHINYVSGGGGTSDRAVTYCFACAKLWGHIGYVAPPGVQHAIVNDIYFSDLGEPLAGYEEDLKAGVAWRVYKRGVVALNSSDRDYRIPSLGLLLTNAPNGYFFPHGR